MSRQALAQDRGLQPERTALAWTRTSLAIAVSGGLLLVKDPDVAHLNPAQLAIGAAAGLTALGVFALGVRRRRMLGVRPVAARSTARREVLCAGLAVLMLAALVVAYLSLPMS